MQALSDHKRGFEKYSTRKNRRKGLTMDSVKAASVLASAPPFCELEGEPPPVDDGEGLLPLVDVPVSERFLGSYSDGTIRTI